MLLNCGVREDSWESHEQKGDPTSQSSRKVVLNNHWKDWCWSLKSQYFGHLMWRTDSFEKTLMLGKIEGRRKRGWQRRRWLDAITNWWTWVRASSRSWWTGNPGVLQWGHKESNMTELLNWTKTFFYKHFLCLGSLRTSRYKWPVHICLLHKDCGCNK